MNLVLRDQRLNGMKRDLEEIQRDREIQLKGLKTEYESFQVALKDL